jgi:hypothetical protein
VRWCFIKPVEPQTQPNMKNCDKMKKKKKNRISCIIVCQACLSRFVPLYPTYRACFKEFRTSILLRTDILETDQCPVEYKLGGARRSGALVIFDHIAEFAPFLPVIGLTHTFLTQGNHFHIIVSCLHVFSFKPAHGCMWVLLEYRAVLVGIVSNRVRIPEELFIFTSLWYLIVRSST